MSQTLTTIERQDSVGIQDLQGLRAKVDERLTSLFADHPAESRLACTIRHGLLSPGKRLRPVMTLLACQQSGGTKAGGDHDLLNAACAVEMLHAASLIMDDLPCMDDARLRRGALTTHMVFGEGAAMLAVIALVSKANSLVRACHSISADARLAAMGHLNEAIGIDGLAGGQDLDLTCPGMGVSLPEMEQRHLEKTGALFSAAAAIGGEFAGATPEMIAHLRGFGCSLGLAYQAFDDVIDVACSEANAGKDVDQDCDKSTVVSLLGTDGARRLAERRLNAAIDAAERASIISPAPLAGLARLIGESFGSFTE